MKLFAIALSFLLLNAISVPAFDRSEWNVRCWNGEERRWVDVGIDKMSLERDGEITKVTNTTGVHRHAHLVFPAELPADFTFTIELRGGYELGFLNREGKDEMLYLELEEGDLDDRQVATYVLSRKGSRISISKDGRPRPLVHFHFDYGEDFLITLALKDGESAEIRSYSMERSE